MQRSSILAHRGWWLEQTEKNHPVALERALQAGFGLETDFRDSNGTLVVSHDPPEAASAPLEARRLFELVATMPGSPRLALNIKADGLSALLAATLAAAGVPMAQIYAFDMSVPDALGYLRAGLPVYTRISEHEHQPAFLDQASGVWVDSFTGDFPQVERAGELLDREIRVAIVSPELHGRDHRPLWAAIARAGLAAHPLFELCTDLPDQAADHFGAGGS